MKQKTNLIFSNQEELDEASKAFDFGNIYKNIMEFPYMLLHTGGGQIVSTWTKQSVLNKVKEAELWSEVAPLYIRRNWYDYESRNGGKIVYVRNHEDEIWKVSIFRRYEKNKGFICEGGYYNFATPCTERDLVQEDK